MQVFKLATTPHSKKKRNMLSVPCSVKSKLTDKKHAIKAAGAYVDVSEYALLGSVIYEQKVKREK